ncbi:MAG: hypothetical protein IH585_14105 [Anaerolineaceae bacterium]|nr:hypothetical protein [Anaerolineaceae bacterium]
MAVSVTERTLPLLPEGDDPFTGRSIDYGRIDPPVYQAGEFEKFVQNMQKQLRTNNAILTMP